MAKAGRRSPSTWGPTGSPQPGPIGALAEAQVGQVKAIRPAARASEPRPRAHPTRLKRADSFLGIHFDFHAGPDCNGDRQEHHARDDRERSSTRCVPTTSRSTAKGIPGLSSYPTKVGNQAPGFVGDPAAALAAGDRRARRRRSTCTTRASGIPRPSASIPTGRAVNADGKTNGNATSFFSPYADQLLIPQLRELAGDYGVDGAWVDGECWASVPDYGERGAEGLPRGDRHPGRPAQARRTALVRVPRVQPRGLPQLPAPLHRRGEADASRACSSAATGRSPTTCPRPCRAPVDWISGDYSPEDSVNSARFSARYLARQGKPWDLMAWGFTHASPAGTARDQKSAVQLQREAAVGAGARAAGSRRTSTRGATAPIREEQMPVMAEVAKFCRARQAVCHRAEPVPQVALLYSTAAHYREINGLFHRDLSRHQRHAAGPARKPAVGRGRWASTTSPGGWRSTR